MQEQKRKLMYDKEDITITRMLNNETGRQIAEISKNTEEHGKKRLLVKGQMAQVNYDILAIESSCNVFKHTLQCMGDANQTEKCCIVSVNDQIK